MQVAWPSGFFPDNGSTASADILADVGFYLFRGFRMSPSKISAWPSERSLLPPRWKRLFANRCRIFFATLLDRRRTRHIGREAASGNSYRRSRESRRSSVKGSRGYCVKRASRKLFSVGDSLGNRRLCHLGSNQSAKKWAVYKIHERLSAKSPAKNDSCSTPS